MILGLAPMDGFTDCAFRQIVKEIFEQYWKKETYELLLWTEFMNADGYCINPTWVIRHLLTDTFQSPVIAQIFWGNEDMLVKCFTDIQEKYFLNAECKMHNSKINNKKSDNSEFWILNSTFSCIELNMGCPARNVMNTWWGSALLKDRKQTLKIIKKLSWAVKMPLSIKTRIGLTEEDRREQIDFLVEVSNYVDMITIHGRTVKQAYSWDADWNFIYEIKEQANKKCKILGNWWIKTYESIASHCKWNTASLDGVMIGQWAIGNPRIFTPHTPSREEIKTTILKHLDYMISYENYFQEQKARYTGILPMPEHMKINIKNPQAITLAEFRKHLFQYVKWIPWSKEFKQEISQISEYKPLVEAIQKFFG